MSSSNGSIPASNSRGGYSADVRLRVECRGGGVFHPGQVGPDRLIFDEPVQLAEGPVEIVVTVDGRESRRAATVAAAPGPARVVYLVS